MLYRVLWFGCYDRVIVIRLFVCLFALNCFYWYLYGLVGSLCGCMIRTDWRSLFQIAFRIINDRKPECYRCANFGNLLYCYFCIWGVVVFEGSFFNF